MPLLIAAIATTWSAPKEFEEYLSRPDPTFGWAVRQEQPFTRLRLASQTWQGMLWEHDLDLVRPSRVRHPNTAMLYITGDRVDDREVEMAKQLGERAGMPVAVLYQIPNQPLWEMREDDLIAHTFEKYFETEDSSWPLLFPMAKSAIRAMDAIEQHTQKSTNPIRKFVVTGASKRGWTTWFVGASGDARVIGIAPMVIDVLNIPAQMRRQVERYGAYSEQIADYSNRGLQEALQTPVGQRLGRMIDPYSYRGQINMPTLIVLGANDEYWTVDAMNLYWDSLMQPKWALIVPNAGHGLGDRQWAYQGLSAFASTVAEGKRLPSASWRSSLSSIVIARHDAGLVAARLWQAESDNLDFRKSEWRVVDSAATIRNGEMRFRFPVGGSTSRAFFVELEWEGGYRTTTQVQVVPARSTTR